MSFLISATTTTTEAAAVPKAIPVEQITDHDVVIEDALLVAITSSDETKRCNAERTTSFYTKLIEVCSEKLHVQRQVDAAWSRENLISAAQKMADIVIYQRRGRFIWSKQLPVRQFVVLDRQEAINKISNDLMVQMRRLVATNRFVVDPKAIQAKAAAATTKVSTNKNSFITEATMVPPEVAVARVQPQLPKENGTRLTTTSATTASSSSSSNPSRRNQQLMSTLMLGSNSDNKHMYYAVRLIMAVCQAETMGLSPLQSAHILDQVPWNSNNTSKKQTKNNNNNNNNIKAASKKKKKHSKKPQQVEEETPRERKMRLLLRHRYLSAAAAGVPLYDFSKALLQGWNIDIPKLAPKRKKPKKKQAKNGTKTKEQSTKQSNGRSSSSAAAASVATLNGTAIATTTTTTLVQDLPPTHPLRQVNKLDFSQNQNNNNVSAEAQLREGVWSASERKIFLDAVEKVGFGQWKETIVPSRTTRQVTSFGRSLLKKFKMKSKDPPNAECRAFLLRDDEEK